MILRACLLLAALLVPRADLLAAKAALSAEVPAKTWKSIRLRGLAKDASLAVRVEASGPINVILVHESELRRFPSPVRPTFAGSLERRLRFRVTVPAAGNYYVILDNRQGAELRTIQLVIEALGVRRPQRKAPEQDVQGVKAI